MSTTNKRPVGRPKLKPEQKKQHFGLYLTVSEHETLKYLAEQVHGHKSPSTFIVELLKLDKGI
ncbi:hypothetical protein [Vibrio fluvialis]|uniref:hypothetical protein n=1 Tax=Vibrio fluvialis TaxID=676 RepID=UPI001BB07493|nr:hypothetical protein [Vibrio fluvialis]QUF70043.1 hypothetical protein KC397_06525 [Vibrio fluvialis]